MHEASYEYQLNIYMGIKDNWLLLLVNVVYTAWGVTELTYSSGSWKSSVRSSSSINQREYIFTICWTGPTFLKFLKCLFSEMRWIYVTSYSLLSVERGDWNFPCVLTYTLHKYTYIHSVLEKEHLFLPLHEWKALNSISFWATLTLK